MFVKSLGAERRDKNNMDRVVCYQGHNVDILVLLLRTQKGGMRVGDLEQKVTGCIQTKAAAVRNEASIHGTCA